MNRTVFFIDGFNLYHSLDGSRACYKWLNLRKLCESYLLKKDVLTDIFYFSALPVWNDNKVKRHKTYLDALASESINIVLGKFKKVKRKCLLGCSASRVNEFQTYEEKETDVNIAIYLLEHALTNKFDKAVIISGDSDLIPPVKRIRELFPKKIVTCIIPKNGYDLGSHSSQAIRLKEKVLKHSLFDKVLKYKGKTIICPKAEWLPQTLNPKP